MVSELRVQLGQLVTQRNVRARGVLGARLGDLLLLARFSEPLAQLANLPLAVGQLHAQVTFCAHVHLDAREQVGAWRDALDDGRREHRSRRRRRQRGGRGRGLRGLAIFGLPLLGRAALEPLGCDAKDDDQRANDAAAEGALVLSDDSWHIHTGTSLEFDGPADAEQTTLLVGRGRDAVLLVAAEGRVVELVLGDLRVVVQADVRLV